MPIIKCIDAEVRVSKIKELRAKMHGVINITVEITKMNSKGKVKMIARCYYHQGRSADNRLQKRKVCWKMVQRRWYGRSHRKKSVQRCTTGLGGRVEEGKTVRPPVREKVRCQL
mgnify:CR=1 FL=1